MTNARELIIWNRHLSLFNNVYEFSMIIVPSIIVAPRYFSGEVLSCVHIFPIGRVSTIHILQPYKAFNIWGYVQMLYISSYAYYLYLVVIYMYCKRNQVWLHWHVRVDRMGRVNPVWPSTWWHLVFDRWMEGNILMTLLCSSGGVWCDLTNWICFPPNIGCSFCYCSQVWQPQVCYQLYDLCKVLGPQHEIGKCLFR